MRKLLLASLLLNAGMLAWIAWDDVPIASSAEAGKGASTACADLNDDGKSDLADAVQLLGWLFLGGPAPPCTDRPDPSDRIAELEDELARCVGSAEGTLPATGQLELFGDYPGQDGEYRVGCYPEDRFVDNGDGTILDICTDLTWQKATVDWNQNGTIEAADGLNWFDALEYCEGLRLGGQDDWRLPNVRELQSIVDYGRHSPALDSVFEAVPSWYWSSTTKVDDTISAWYVDFSIGYVYRDNSKANRHFVRAVRGGR